MSYDKKFRERAIQYYEKGHTYKETSEAYGISPNTLNAWIKEKRERGSYDRKYRSYETKINEAELTAYLKDNPNAYQAEIAEHFACDISTVSRTLKRLKITRKKR